MPTCAAFFVMRGNMARNSGQIIRRGFCTWLVRVHAGRDPETRRCKYIGKCIHGDRAYADPQWQNLQKRCPGGGKAGPGWRPLRMVG